MICWACGTHEKEEICLQGLTGEAEGKRELARPRRR
jgi:hypothetical protein